MMLPIYYNLWKEEEEKGRRFLLLWMGNNDN